VTVGASMGGYAAIRAGVMLGATTAIAFGPQVRDRIRVRDRVGLGLGSPVVYLTHGRVRV